MSGATHQRSRVGKLHVLPTATGLSTLARKFGDVFTMITAVRSRRWTVALLPAMVVLCTPLGAMAVKPKQVLLLHSFGREFATYAVIVAAFRSQRFTTQCM